ncbi:MAG TPA: PIG-L family deacetylase [Verrucomicrobiota bacterium]|nr:PIG-L family deacetylase [Verrucomicrobiota bacterium]HNT15238.1 PIG-L family deacetylase [Verrucomicrobiota bacterium]
MNPAQIPSRSPCWREAARMLSGALAFAVVGGGVDYAKGTELPPSPAAIRQELVRFHTLGSVLLIAAHPDDENTQLITYLSRGRGYRMAYLSLTRGDGGQNVIGPEFDEKLGVARTQELLAARRLDGGRQFFTRAIDFGYSKTPEETLRIWDRHQVLGDIVRVIREFQPDVIITRFPVPPGSGGHGHHTASGILGLEAYKLAGDPQAYPEQIQAGLQPWQARRVLWNESTWQHRNDLAGPTIQVDIGGTDPVTGEGFGTIAARSRAQHITQGFANFNRGSGSGPTPETFRLLAGDPPTNDLMDGIDLTWGRFPGGAAVGELTQQALAAFDPESPARSVPAVLAIRAKLQALPVTPVLADKRRQLDHLLQACLGLRVTTTAARPEVVPGETVTFAQTVGLASDVPVRWVETRLHHPAQTHRVDAPLTPGSARQDTITLTVPMATPLTQPYWLREPGTSGMYRVDDPTLIGTAENPPAFPVDYVFDVGGQTLVVADEPRSRVKDATTERLRRVEVIPPVSLRFLADVHLFHPGRTRPVTVEVTAARPELTGTVQLEPPAGWKVLPATREFSLPRAGARQQLSFEVTAPPEPATARITASALLHHQRYAHQRIEINYAHLPFILLQPPAQSRLVAVDFSVRGNNVGYLPGAGDATVAALEQLGCHVTTLTGGDLTPDKLRALDAVVIGVRAFNEREDLAPHLASLFAYVTNGGTVIVQYNRPSGLKTSELGPYPLSIQGPAPQLRVTDEHAAVTFLDPQAPVLTSPNRITAADFEGWVQERGLYFPSRWDEQHYAAVLAMADPGEPPLSGALLVARHGRGYYVYTGLAFFRQLPQGVPGAYRLFANLLSLGK